MHRLITVAALLAVAAMVVVASGSAAKASSSKSHVSRGGVLTYGWEQAFGSTDNFDPTGEYLGDWFGIASSLLIRSLVGYNHVAGGPGNVTVPDLAQSWDIANGGVLTYGWEQAFGSTDNFDPTGEYLGDWFGIASSLLIRSLVGYNHVAGGPGNVTVPDLAQSWDITNGGKTYTFHLRHGVKFAPPVSREITATDILTAMKRLANPKDGAEYAFYYSVIRGFDAGKGRSISGIRIPNPYTIVFNLTKPTGDFLKRMAMPATGPMPAEVVKCFEGQPGKYGQNLVSSGPYMIAGSDKVDASACSNIKPASGYDGQTIYDLVRNPNYDAKTDSRAARENYPDEFKFIVNASFDDIYNKIEAGEMDMATSTIPPTILKKYCTPGHASPRCHQNSGDRTWYMYMNMTQAPFDDLYVRRAMNWVVNKNALVQAWGGPVIGDVANHIVPDSMFNNQLAEYKPYRTDGNFGSVEKAKKELKQSKYGDKKTGMCTASACKNILLVADTRGVDDKMLPVIQADAKKIGISFKLRTIKGAYPTLQTPKNNVAISERPGWGKDYGDASTFFIPLFASYDIIPSGNPNYSLVGLTPSIAKKVGAGGNTSNVPSVDADIDKCQALSDPARTACWENLDKKLMTKVVPWVPYLWAKVTRVVSTKVTKYEFDQFGTTPSFAHIAVK